MNPIIKTILNGVKSDMAAKVAKRIVREEEILAKLAVASHWSGHTCRLPEKERTYEGFHWRCSVCKQYWHIRVIDNKHHWQMFGIDPFSGHK